MNRLTLSVRADHPTAAGHFPGNPILPGALLLAEVVHLIGAEVGIDQAAYEVRAAKFLRPVRPGDQVSIEYARSGATGFDFHCTVAGARVLAGAFGAAVAP